MTAIVPYPDINKILLGLSETMQAILGKNLIGLYLFGSLSYKVRVKFIKNTRKKLVCRVNG